MQRSLAETAALSIVDATHPRPSPQDMARAIQLGVNDEVFVNAGVRIGIWKPKIERTLAAVGNMLPYIDAAMQKVADDASGDHPMVVFAARDAECMYDYFSIVHGSNIPHVLFPGSTAFSRDLSQQNTNTVASLLRAYGISNEFLSLPGSTIQFIDTGFRGTVGENIDNAIAKVYSTDSLIGTGRMVLKMVSAPSWGNGTHILTDQELWAKGMSGIDVYDMAIAMQQLPRYHGAYSTLKGANADVTDLVCAEEKLTRDVDAVHADLERVNASIVNPVAAAMVQRLIVRAALQRVGQL